MRNSTATRSLAAIFSSLMLSLCIAVLANAPCTLANHSQMTLGGQCVIDLNARKWTCTTDSFDPGNCNGTMATKLGCRAGSALRSSRTYGSLSCYKEGDKCQVFKGQAKMDTYHGNWGACITPVDSALPF